MKLKIWYIILILILFAGILTGCGGDASTSSEEGQGSSTQDVGSGADSTSYTSTALDASYEGALTASSSVSPAWSPDGNYIAFLTDRAASTTAGGEWEIWVMKADGSGQGPLFDTELKGLTLNYAFASERAIDWTW